MPKAAKDYDPEDDEPWSNPIMDLMKSEPKVPEPPKRINDEKVALIEYNECPCCNGKGFVTIIHEKNWVNKGKR